MDINLLLDMNLKGCRYTWCNNRLDGCVREKIDRVMVNAKWLECFPNAFGEALPAIGFDHSPIVLHSDVIVCRRKKMFVYEQFWDEHPKCAENVAAAWTSSALLPRGAEIGDRIEKVKTGLSSWS